MTRRRSHRSCIIVSALLVWVVTYSFSVVTLRAAWDKGFNFRSTAGYVSDGANESAVLADTYPTTFGNGAVGGWTAGGQVATNGQKRDRNSALDRRLAGLNFAAGPTTDTFRLDVPATGDYTIRMALGDASNAETNLQVLIKDGATTLATITQASQSSATFTDATSTNYSAANWPGSNTSITVTMSNGTNMSVIVGTGTTDTGLAHLFVSQVSVSRAPNLLLLGVGN